MRCKQARQWIRQPLCQIVVAGSAAWWGPGNARQQQCFVRQRTKRASRGCFAPASLHCPHARRTTSVFAVGQVGEPACLACSSTRCPQQPDSAVLSPRQPEMLGRWDVITPQVVPALRFDDESAVVNSDDAMRLGSKSPVKAAFHQAKAGAVCRWSVLRLAPDMFRFAFAV